MTQSKSSLGRRKVLLGELTLLRGFRLSTDIEVAGAAVEREREVQEELEKLPVPENVVAEDEEAPLAVNFSRQPGETEERK